MRGTTRPAVSIKRVLGTARGFFKFLCDEGLLPNDPAGSLTSMRAPERLPKCVLTPSEAGKIIGTPDTQTVLGYRDRSTASQQIRRRRQPPPELSGDLQRWIIQSKNVA